MPASHIKTGWVDVLDAIDWTPMGEVREAARIDTPTQKSVKNYAYAERLKSSQQLHLRVYLTINVGTKHFKFNKNETALEKKRTAEERLASMERLREEFKEFKPLLQDAFDELHSHIVAKISSPGAYLGPHYDYPKLSLSQSGFPMFRPYGTYDKAAPRDFLSIVRRKGLLGFMGGEFDIPADETLKHKKLKEFLHTHKIGEKLIYTDLKGDEAFSDFALNRIIGSAVQKYMHRHGVTAPIDPTERNKILTPLMRGIILSSRKLTLMVPIALTHFDFERYRLSESTYLARIPKGIQISRARMSAMGSGASEQVVHAATHAFISNDWTIDVKEIGDATKSLTLASDNALEAVDNFLGALRIATGIKTGYAQILWLPRGWAIEYYCNLPITYGATVRQYPNEFDKYGWANECPSVTAREMDSVKRVYDQMINNNSEAVRLAIKRLSSCLTRNDSSDAVLDGTIGLELLLGDDQNQSLSYKLRLRAAALCWLENNGESASEIASNIKRIYDARSAIVHGIKSKQKKRAVDQNTNFGEDNRQLAAELLRFVLRVLLANPEYLDPSKIDSELLLRGKF